MCQDRSQCGLLPEPCHEEIYCGTLVLYVRVASGHHFLSYREVFGHVVVKVVVFQ